MKRIIIFAFSMLLLVSCSSLLLEPEAHENVLNEEGLPMTKSGAMKGPDYDLSAVRYYFQTNRRILLMHHVEYRDSSYVQTLSDDDMRSFGITDEQKEFGNQYIVKLNLLCKQH